MQQPKEYYQAQMSRLTILLKKHRQRRNGITLAKVFLFLLAIYFIYTFANTEYTPYLIAFIAAIVLFIITNIFEFGDKDVTDVMTSRKKIDAIDVNMSVEKALNYMLDEPYSRYPLYEDDIDNIVGVLYLKDVIDAYLNQKEATLSDIAREPFFVHQTMNLSVLFQEMQTKKIHMAIVIDEYSQTEGIVSMEDMLEVIVGNILDEYDVEDRNITKIGWADIYLVRGSTRLEELEDTLGIEFDVEDIETLNGFLIDQLGHLPEDNEEIEIIYQGYSFKSVDIHDNMIRQVKVEKRKRKEEEDVRTQ